ncbi:MAG: hypothetical protein R3281_14710 [Balneolaceae bacterium]|nr:hypothetical protein [Balneolaceae bacterium]
MKSLKKITAKVLAIALIVGMAAGCASVTDATIADGPVDTTTIDQPVNPTSTLFGEDDVQPIVDKP